MLGQPGAGKSWELTRLSEELSHEGAVVAKHYCYLEPGDELVEQRITTNTLFGNLLAELVDGEPALVEAGGARYSAGLSELEKKLEAATKLGRPVVLIVDGLDHIARVRADASSLSDEDVDIVERLATLAIPAGVGLIIGSQQGEHLCPLRERWGSSLVECQVPTWGADDIKALALCHGVEDSMIAAGIAKIDDLNRILNVLADCADGNPLYARYLSHGLSVGLRAGEIDDPIEWLMNVPSLTGDIAKYYAFLYKNSSREAQCIADVLGVIDFSVSEGDLREIFPAFLAGYINPALNSLKSVLTITQGQGGIRIFHESFRRFMKDELARQGRSLGDALQPVIAWLEKVGFFNDARSYRFLLPALRRAGRGSEVLERVSTIFVSESLAYAYPLEAIEKNIALAADVAASSQDWPMMVRCTELHRSAYTAFEEIQGFWGDYWKAYLELFGVEACAERLVFDGRPTRGYKDGLLACQLIDNAGGAAPWREYLALENETESPIPDDMPDDQFFLVEEERLSLAALQGRFRLGDPRIINKVIKYFMSLDENFRTGYVRQVAALMAHMHGTGLVARMAALADALPTGEVRLAPKVAAVLRLGLADEYRKQGMADAATSLANQAVAHIDSPELAIACLLHGADAKACATHALPLGEIDIFFEEGFEQKAIKALSWCYSAQLLMNGDDSMVQIVKDEHRRLQGEGWYPCWLRFVLGIASVDAAKRKRSQGDIIGAFETLVLDTHPFKGSPRACDLYQVESVIHKTIQLALSLLNTQDEWNHALTVILRVSGETGSRLDREDGGPLPMAAILDLLLPHVSTSDIGRAVMDAIENQTKRFENVGTYYSTHADFSMRLARARKSAGDETAAMEAWYSASRYLAAYGFHKDSTLFDLIASAPSLTALQKCQLLTNAVLKHTDLRETKNCPNAWFRKLLDYDPAQAISLLAQTVIEDEGIDGWMLEDALKDVSEKIIGDVDPVLIDALLSSLKFTVAYEDSVSREIDLRFAPIIRLISEKKLPINLFYRASAEILNDNKNYTSKVLVYLRKVTDEKGLTMHSPSGPDEILCDGDSRREYGRTRSKGRKVRARSPLFPPEASLVDILSGLRAGKILYDMEDSSAWDEVVLSLGYLLCDLVDEGREDDSKRILRFFAREVPYYSSETPHPLSRLAESLANAGYIRLATISYMLAYTATRGGGGWLTFGDTKHSVWVDRAIQLDRELALRTISDEVGNALKSSWYPAGLSRNLIKRMADWGDVGVANQSWNEFFTVIAHRLPLAPDNGPFAKFEYDNSFGWSTTESLIAVLLSRLAEPRLSRKLAVFGGITWAFKSDPNAVKKPLHWWLSRGGHMSSVLLVLDALRELGNATDEIVLSVSDLLRSYAAGDSWSASKLATVLLNRVGLQAPRGKSSFQEQRSHSRELPTEIFEFPMAVQKIWPELRQLTLARWRGLWEKGIDYIDHSRAVFKLAAGRDGVSTPLTPVLWWEREIFLTALNEQLAGLSEYLWKQGKWSEKAEQEVLEAVLPASKVHLGVVASRVPRPDLSKPVSCVSSENKLTVIGGEDLVYQGWTRLAWFERQFVVASSDRYSKPSEVVTVFSGAVVKPIGASIPQDAFPFYREELINWWDVANQDYFTELLRGQLVPMVRVTDWLCDSFIFYPPPILLIRKWFSLPSLGDAIVLKDRDMSPAMVFRSWRVKAEWSLWSEPSEYLGCDLIVRPDLMDELILWDRVFLDTKLGVERLPMR